jgi:hypothetical protein
MCEQWVRPSHWKRAGAGSAGGLIKAAGSAVGLTKAAGSEDDLLNFGARKL